MWSAKPAKHSNCLWLFTQPGTHHSMSGHFPALNRLRKLKTEKKEKKVLSSFFHLVSFSFSACVFSPRYLFVPFSFSFSLTPPPLSPLSSSARLTCHSSSFVPTGLFLYWTPRPLHSFGSPFPSQGPNYEPALNKNIYISPKKGFSLCFLWTMRACDSPLPFCSRFLSLSLLSGHSPGVSVSLCDWLALGLLGGSNCVSLSLTVVVMGV